MTLKFKKNAILAAVALIGAAATTVAVARHGHDSQHSMRWVERIVTSQLDLDEEQQQKLAEIKRVVQAAKQRHQADREQHVEEIEQLILADSLDQDQVDALISQHRQRMDSVMPDLFDAVSDFHESLSDEQKQKAVDTLRRFHERHQH